MANTESYVTQHASAADTNSGSSAAGPAYTATNGGWNSGTGVFTPASGNPSLTVNVGDWAAIYTDGASSTSFIGRVTAVSTTTITVSITAKTGTVPTTGASGISCKVGGAWATIQRGALLVSVTALNVAGDPPRCNIKIEGGASYNERVDWTTNAGTTAIPLTFEGFTSTPGDENWLTSTNRVLITPGSVVSSALNNINQGHVIFRNLEVLNNQAGADTWINGAEGVCFQNCKITFGSSANRRGYNGSNIKFYRCIVVGSTQEWEHWTGDFCQLFGCISVNRSSSSGASSAAIAMAGNSTLENSMIYGSGVKGVSISGNQNSLKSNTIADNAGDGLAVSGRSQSVIGNVICANGGYGINASSVGELAACIANVVSGNTSGQINPAGLASFNGGNDTSTAAFVTSSASTRKTNGDYRIVSGLYATGFPGLLADQSITSKQGYVDPGALQHPDAGGGTAGTVATMS